MVITSEQHFSHQSTFSHVNVHLSSLSSFPNPPKSNQLQPGFELFSLAMESFQIVALPPFSIPFQIRLNPQRLKPSAPLTTPKPCFFHYTLLSSPFLLSTTASHDWLPGEVRGEKGVWVIDLIYREKIFSRYLSMKQWFFYRALRM